MAQVKLLKISSDGVPLEFDSATDEITLLSYSVNNGPSLSQTGLDMADTNISDLANVTFNDPTTNTIGQTAGALIIDNIMAKDRANLMTTVSDITFPVVANVSGEVDALRLPALSGVPSATPTSGGEGHVVWDSDNNKLYIWGGSSWVDVASQGTATDVINSYTAEVAVAARDVVYISSANNVSPALANNTSASYAIGFANTSAAPAAQVAVKTDGIIGGFSGLTAGSRYYLSSATAGGIQATVPTGSGNTVVQVGYAKSASEIQIQILQLGRRA